MKYNLTATQLRKLVKLTPMAAVLDTTLPAELELPRDPSTCQRATVTQGKTVVEIELWVAFKL